MLAMTIVCHRYFERFIILSIMLSSVKLAVETYYLDDPSNSVEERLFTSLDYLLSAVFGLEAALKITAMGLCQD